jgi:hypothetical protein
MPEPGQRAGCQRVLRRRRRRGCPSCQPMSSTAPVQKTKPSTAATAAIASTIRPVPGACEGAGTRGAASALPR